jgi:hypothetical protein
MQSQTEITKVERDDGDGLIVHFSDGTSAGYVAEELLKLRPHREQADPSDKANENGRLLFFDRPHTK